MDHRSGLYILKKTYLTTAEIRTPDRPDCNPNHNARNAIPAPAALKQQKTPEVAAAGADHVQH